MNFVFSHHARLRMVERGISEDEVRSCVLNYLDRHMTRGKNKYRANVGGRRIKVVVAGDRDNDVEKFIVSVMEEQS